MEAVPVQKGAAVEVHELRKEFRRKDSRKRGEKRGERRSRVALDGVSFTMATGETVAILGQNGSGKSTLVRLLSTLLLPDGGYARILGHDVVAEHRAVRRVVNRVSVEASFFKKMSAAENLSYAARYYGMTAKQTRGKIPEILERVGFPADRRDEPMEALSRGMQQKVALARALLTSPVVLLLDEPTTGLDPRSKLEVQEFVREIRDSHDSTILLCTHDLAEAEALANRIGILDRGRLLALESAEAIKQRYGADTLEEAFFAATGRAFEAEAERRRRRQGGVRLMRAMLGTMRAELVGAGGVVERNAYLTKRYIWWDLAWFVWTVANTLTIVFIAKGIEAEGGTLDVEETMTTLLIGAVVWAYLGILFEFLMETVAWERWEGTIEYTFMAPLSRAMHLAGQGVFAILYGLLRATFLFVICGFVFFDLSMPDADFFAAFVVLLVASVSFIGIGMMMSVLPLISPEKGTQLGFVAQGTLLVVSGVYYPVEVLPQWMQWIATISPATYALEGARAAILEGAPLSALWSDIWPLIVIGAVSIPLGLWVFARGETYAKRHGKLKRSG